jgi:hypothetical protein
VPEEAPAETRALPSRRVWLVVCCAVVVVVFLALVLPGVFEVKHGKRSYSFRKGIDRLVFDSKGTVTLDISPSADGRVRIARTSKISTDSRLVERHRIAAAGKTLVFTTSCTGSRLGLLRRCEMTYRVRVPRKIALTLKVHLGQTSVTGVRGKLDFSSDAGDFTGSACSDEARLSLGFGRLALTDTCTPKLVRARVKAGDIELTVPSGRYDVKASTRCGSVDRPFPNVIEDQSSPNKLDVAMSLGGSIRIEGAEK